MNAPLRRAQWVCRVSVVRSSIVARHPNCVEILSGNLADISLTSLLQLAQYEVISGWLEVSRRGEVAISKGHVLDARCGPLTGVEALRELLFHRGGRFTLVRGEPEERRVIENVTFAVMDAYRLRDEWARLAGVVLEATTDRPWKPTGGLLDTVAVQFDGQRTVEEAVTSSSPFFTLLIDALIDAIGLGLFVRATPRAPATPEPELDFYQLIDRGQALMRSGSYEAAEQQLRRALALRPDDRVAQQNLRALTQRRRCA